MKVPAWFVLEAAKECPPSPDWSTTVDRTGIDYTCPHDLDLRLHPRCYLCQPETVNECGAVKSIQNGTVLRAHRCVNTVGHQGRHGPWRAEPPIEVKEPE